jgi:hypothetical protein
LSDNERGEEKESPESPSPSSTISRRKMLAAIGLTGAAAIAGYSALLRSGAAAAPAAAPEDEGGAAMNAANVFQTVSDMKQAASISEGMQLSTMGYFEPGDGGGAQYIVVSLRMPEDGGSVIGLSGGLLARLLPNCRYDRRACSK